jgi:hypothetical protein
VKKFIGTKQKTVDGGKPGFGRENGRVEQSDAVSETVNLRMSRTPHT